MKDTWNVFERLAIALYASTLTLHLGSSIDFLKDGMRLFIVSDPVTSTNFPAVLVTPCLTSLLSSSNNSMM